ncbi:ABC transporter substrate-binding protein [Protofrankia symbiont of Coriaria ruscifolia]|uniref:ABC transporter substrate-binding protein n=1 Tax=Protofrankia symbiont of Coriaria ruscifolia TaxID=1306542 RepID=UPI0010412FB9|nr:ABC transporter substrate-binding protein [Protofrankia symbiont of Coriaria ruscifolia]
MSLARPGRPQRSAFTGARGRLRVTAVFAAATTALLGGLSACGSSSESGGSQPAAATAAKPVTGGTLTYAGNITPTCLDPQVTAQDATAMIDRNIVDSLVYQAPDGSFHPWLASSWKTSADLKTFTFTLRSGVRFHDGAAFDASAVKINFDRVYDPATKSRSAVNLLGPYSGSKVINPTTVEVSFTKPFAQFLQSVSQTFLGIQSPQAIQKDAAALCTHPVGSGPYTLAEYVRNQSVTLTRNPDYAWAPEGAAHSGPAYLDRLVFTFVPDNAVRLGVLTSGQADVVDAIPPVNIKALAANKNVRVLRTLSPGGGYTWHFNTSRAPFNDEKFRQAFRAALPIDKVLESLYFGEYQRSWSPLSPATPGYLAAVEKSWGYDVARSNSLLDELGWTSRDGDGYRTKDGKRLIVHRPFPAANISEQRDSLVESFQAALKDVGIDLVVDNITQGEYFTRYDAGDYDIYDFTWGGDTPDVLRLFFDSTNRPSPGNINQNASQLVNAQVDTWLGEANTTLDDARRKTLYGNVQKYVIDHAVVLPVYVGTRLIGSSTEIQGLTSDASGFASFYGAWRAP